MILEYRVRKERNKVCQRENRSGESTGNPRRQCTLAARRRTGQSQAVPLVLDPVPPKQLHADEPIFWLGGCQNHAPGMHEPWGASGFACASSAVARARVALCEPPIELVQSPCYGNRHGNGSDINTKNTGSQQDAYIISCNLPS